ncbi:hypothetical protein [Xenophilus sp.]|uniref:hypothetical protein n=1 Tax=Xenophilus sp. TaxID=1873499 RepID=UPI0037DD0A1F
MKKVLLEREAGARSLVASAEKAKGAIIGRLRMPCKHEAGVWRIALCIGNARFG